MVAMKTNTDFAEIDAATAYARAWNRLDGQCFFKLLAEDACYASQYVFSELTSRTEIEEYLTGKMESVKASGGKVRAELGRIVIPYEKPCVLLYQNSSDDYIAVVVFEIGESNIRRFDLCVPEMYTIEKRNVFPI